MFQIAGGIILAILFFVCLPYLLVASAFVLVGAVVLGVLILVVIHFNDIAGFAAALPTALLENLLPISAVLIGVFVPMLVVNRIRKRYPKYDALLSESGSDERQEPFGLRALAKVLTYGFLIPSGVALFVAVFALAKYFRP